MSSGGCMLNNESLKSPPEADITQNINELEFK